MKFKVKLYLTMFTVAIISVGFGIGFMVYDFFHHVLLTQSIIATTVAATTSVFLDPSALEKIRTEKDMNTPQYLKIKDQLIKVRDVNQRKYLYIAWIYAIRPSPENPEQMVYIVDSEANPALAAHVGTALLPQEYGGLKDHLQGFYSTQELYTDPRGTWLTGFAPLYNAQGDYVCTIGADLAASEIIALRDRYIESIVYIFIGISALAFLGSFFLVRHQTKSLNTLHSALETIGKGNLETIATIRSKDEFAELAKHINLMTKGLKERERLRAGFAHYVSQHMLEKITTVETTAKLEGERRKVTILFAGIQTFAHLAETLPPEQVVAQLNEYFESMIEVIFAHEGMLDKFIGDGLMVEFGAPKEDEMQERHAIETAIAMQKELETLNAHWVKANHPALEMGIGIHTGYAILGNIGSAKRMEYTAIGDAVNIAARLQQATKRVNQAILASEETMASQLGHFDVVDMGMLVLPGREEPVHAYALNLSQ